MNKSYINKVEMINEFLSSRPDTVGIFGYGSGVTKQNGYNEKDKPQIDLIIAVENDKEWHNENIMRNPNDYSFTGKLFFRNAPTSCYHLGSDICYIPNIEFHNQTYKMGIINKDALIDDLVNWRTFYLAGRFQKPILAVKTNNELDSAILRNRQNALITALLLLDNKKHNEHDLYTKICSLSYLGDTRMGIAENPNKVNNIVDGSYDAFENVYGSFNLFQKNNEDNEISYNIDYLTSFIEELPLTIEGPQNKLFYTNEELIKIMESIKEQLLIKNRNTSATQTIKGLLTAGPSRSLEYVYQKVRKRLKAKH